MFTTIFLRKKIFFQILFLIVLTFFITSIVYAIESWHKLEKDTKFEVKTATPSELLIKDLPDKYQNNQKFLIPMESNFLMTSEQTDRILLEQEASLKSQNDKTIFSNGKNLLLKIDYNFDADLKHKHSNIFDVTIKWKYQGSNANFIEYSTTAQPAIIDNNGNLKKILINIMITAKQPYNSLFKNNKFAINMLYNIVK